MAVTEPITDPAAATAALVQAVKDHALAHYENGWDAVQETMDNRDLAERITEAGARTPAEAVAAFSNLVSVWVERTGPHWPITFCPRHPTVRLTSVFPEEEPSECSACIHEQDQRRDAAPLWVDDSTYSGYQSYDPHAGQDQSDYPQFTLLGDHTEDLCVGEVGYGRQHRCAACRAQDAQRPQPTF